MMTTQTNLWTMDCEHIVDQRDEFLPPTWAEQPGAAEVSPLEELGDHVHISGKQRQVAGRLVALLGVAREVAVVSSFLLADKQLEDAMLEAAERGVRVYVLIASETRLGREDSDGEFDKRVLAQHKAMLQRLAGHVLIRSAPHFHAKMVLVDMTTRPAGVLLTANLTKEALERNEELAVELTPNEVREAAALAGWAMWETAEHEMVDPKDRFRSVKPVERLQPPKAGIAIKATTPQRTELCTEALSIIDSARSSIIVASFGWDKDHAVVQRLCARAQEGVEVTVLARVRPSSMAALLTLEEAGAEVYGYRWLHAKAIWADAGAAMVMSANLQRHGLDEGFELGVVLHDERADELALRLLDWADRAPWRLYHAPRMGDVMGKVQVWREGQLHGDAIAEYVEVTLPPQTATSAEDLSVPMPDVPKNGKLPRMAHALRYRWSASAPRLAVKAKEYLKPKASDGSRLSYSPPVYRESKRRRVVLVRSPDELEAAKRVKEDVEAAAIVVASDVL